MNDSASAFVTKQATRIYLHLLPSEAAGLIAPSEHSGLGHSILFRY